MSDKHRLEFDFSAAGLKKLDALKTRLDAGSRAEVVRRALALLDYVVELDVYVQKPDGTSERLQIL